MNYCKLTQEQREDRLRILDISYLIKGAHIGSCLSSVDLISAVYSLKQPSEKFVLSNGHAGVALYVVLERLGIMTEVDILKQPIHPVRNEKLGIDVSTGSLGQGLTVAVGLALADRLSNVYCLLGDGEMTEGSIWESLRIAQQEKLANLKILVNADGWGGYGQVDRPSLKKRLAGFTSDLQEVDGHDLKKIKTLLSRKVLEHPVIIFAHTIAEQLPVLQGQDEHYHVLTEVEYLKSKEYFL
ncbi:MAG: thiamine pyrophosphate-dependent enzyme [Patescibacteria group bacterium]|nr:thiamine pyrophosphate-dependent enzyme [Patescibacteria group bacterium]